MANEGLYENSKDLRKETRDAHRALISLQEELEAVDWYRQRADACNDTKLREILLHNMQEEMEHASMLIEWLRRNNDELDGNLRTYVFSNQDITEAGENTKEEAIEDPSKNFTIGTLKE